MAAFVAAPLAQPEGFRKVMIEKRKMLGRQVALAPASGMVHLFRFAYPRDASEDADRSLQGLVFDGFSGFAGAQEPDHLPGTAR